MSILSINNVSFKYNNNDYIFNNLSFNFIDNSFTLIFGDSGTGKSTFLKLITGLYPFFKGSLTNGSILLNNKNIINYLPYERIKYISLLFQNPDTQFTMSTPFKQLTFTLENINTNPNIIEDKINTIFSILNIDHLKNININLLSGGQKQLVALANIIVADSQIIVLDEPFSNIDEVNRNKIINYLKKLQLEYNKTIIISDHDLSGYNNIVTNLYKINHNEISSIHLNYLNSFNKIFTRNYNLYKDYPYELSIKNLNINIPNTNNYLLIDTSFNLPFKKLGLLSGLNGVGKSSFFLTIAKLHKYSGYIYFNNKDISKISIKKWSKISSLVFQQSLIQFITTTVEEELELSKKASNNSNFWNINKIDEYLTKLNLYSLKKRAIYSLSGGEQKKLQLLIVLIISPKILLLDEPLSGLDYISIKVVLNLLINIIDELNMSILIISHQNNILYNFIDYELVLENKTINFIGGSKNEK